MKQKLSKDRRVTIYEPLLFGALAIAVGVVYLIVKAIV